MAITSITIENFKGIGDAVTIPIRPITLLFGKNSSGKSTVLQALHYMREVCEHAGADPDRTHIGGDYIDLGGFRSLVHLHQLDRKIRIRIEFDLISEESERLCRLLKHKKNLDSAWIEIVTSWDAEKENVYTESYGFGLNGIEWMSLVPTGKPEASPSNTASSNGVEWYRLSDTMFLNIAYPDIKLPIEDDYIKILLEGLFVLREIVFKDLRDIRYLGPMRKIPSRDYRPQQTPDESLWAEGLEAWNTLGRNPELVKEINRYMRDILKLEYSISRQEIIPLNRDSEIMENLRRFINSKDFKVDELKKRISDLIEIHPEIRIKLHDKKNDVDLDLVDVGLGISQVVPVLVGALHCDRPDPKKFYMSKPPGGFFAVEQPELHLHPAVQVALGDTFIDSIKYNHYHPTQVALKRVLENIENEDHFKEFFEFMRENCGHPDIQEEADKIIENIKNSNYSDTQEAIERLIENIRKKRDHPDIQLAIKKYLEKSNQVAFEEFSYGLKNSGHRTMLVETHSEHLLLRLLRRVRETNVRNSKKHEWRQSSMTPLVRETSEATIRDSEDQDSQDHQLTPDDLSVVYVRPTPEGIKFTPISVTDDGDFYAPWPEGFFDERVKELF